ncbi:MAG: CapA family protein [Solirubrobacteraceae bacterium]|nr:CapA family protein [Solirubrobacteraceae bacterium]
MGLTVAVLDGWLVLGLLGPSTTATADATPPAAARATDANRAGATRTTSATPAAVARATDGTSTGEAPAGPADAPPTIPDDGSASTPPAPTPDTPRVGVTRGPSSVVPGGRVRLTVSGVRLPARAQERVGRTWRVRGEPITGSHTRFRLATTTGSRAQVRVIGADGSPTPVLRIPLRAVSLAAVGDVNLHPAPLGAIAGGDVHGPWRHVGPILRTADIAVGNLETSISTRGTPFPKAFTFRGSPSALRAARDRAGLDVLSLANNHTGDYGRDALLDTVRWVRRLGMAPVGAGRDVRDATRHRVVERRGLRVAFVAFNEILPIEFRAGDDRPGTAWITPDAVRRAIVRARRGNDVVVASFHWGMELATSPSSAQQATARVALDAGATVVLGHHPHVLQPTVRVGRRVVAYSLGNFVFPAHSPGTTRSTILHLDLVPGRVVRYRLRPVTIRGATPVPDR